MLESGVRSGLQVGGGGRFIIVVKDILVDTVTKHLEPGRGVEVGKTVNGGRYGCEPVVKDDVELRCNGPSGWVKNKGHSTGMLCGEADVHTALRAWLPTGKLLAIGNRFVKDVDRATPHMKVMKF